MKQKVSAFMNNKSKEEIKLKKVLRLIPSFLLYLFSLALLVFAIWALTRSMEIVTQALEMGQIDSVEGRYDIINFLMSSCCQYFIYAIILAALGVILQRKPVVISDSAVSAPPAKEQAGDEDINGVSADKETEDNGFSKVESDGDSEEKPDEELVGDSIEEPDYKQYERPKDKTDETNKDKSAFTS